MDEVVKMVRCDICRGDAQYQKIKIWWPTDGDGGDWYQIDLCSGCGHDMEDALLPILKQLEPLGGAKAKALNVPVPKGYRWMYTTGSNGLPSRAHLTLDGVSSICGFSHDLRHVSTERIQKCQRCVTFSRGTGVER